MNIIIKCKECNNDFNFTDSEQQFYYEKNFKNPKICKNCRTIKKRDVEAYTYHCKECNKLIVLNGLEKDKLKGYQPTCDQCNEWKVVRQDENSKANQRLFR